MERPRYSFPRSHRLTTPAQFARVYAARANVSLGPLLVRGLPNDLDHPRLGLAVGRRAGKAVKRNRIKRLVREAFRLVQHDLPGAYDLVVSVRPHQPLTLEAYKDLLVTAAQKLEGICKRKAVKAAKHHRSEDSATSA